ncbi:MAG: carboxy terminal-processing peptidase [Pseudomonadota bacterium]
MSAQPADPVEPATAPVLEPLDVHPRTSLTVVEQLRHNHYVRRVLDDGVSSNVFDKYIATLDNQRAYFLAADIEEFEGFRYKLDDALKRGDLVPAYEIYNRFQMRIVDRLQYLMNEVADGVDDIDFGVDESIEIDREEAPWFISQSQQDEFWRKRLKAAVLSMRLSDKDNAEIADTLTKRYKNRLKQTLQNKSEDAFGVYINAFATSYDPHTQYFSPRTSQNFNINMSLSLEGIGAVLRSEEDSTSVVRLVPAGPADKAGTLDVDDKIVGVGQGENGPIIDVVGWRLDDVVELIRGPKGSLVRLEIKPAKSEHDTSKVIEITRNTVKLEEQAAQAKLLTINEQGRDYNIGVISIPTFYLDFRAHQAGDPNARSSTRDVKRLINELKQEDIDGLVIDLRNNGGGSLQEADSLTGLFIESGPTVQVKSARRRANVYADTDDLVAWDGPMAVLVNRLSASASEIFAGAIQDYGRGVVVGSQTFGKGTVQTLIPLNRGQLKITAAKYYRVSGQSTQHQGVLPDISFPELYDIEQVGESALDDAMPWDMIQPAVYDRSTQLSPLMQELQLRHDARTEDDVDFNYFRAIAAKSRENAAKTSVSLNETVRREEKAADDNWRLTLENTLRAAKGKALADNLDHLEELQDAEDEASETEEGAQDETEETDTTLAQSEATPTEEDTLEMVEDDAMVEETGRILLDMIGLSLQIASAENLPHGLAVQSAPKLPDPQTAKGG